MVIHDTGAIRLMCVVCGTQRTIPHGTGPYMSSLRNSAYQGMRIFDVEGKYKSRAVAYCDTHKEAQIDAAIKKIRTSL